MFGSKTRHLFYTSINSVFIDCWICYVIALGVTSNKKTPSLHVMSWILMNIYVMSKWKNSTWVLSFQTRQNYSELAVAGSSVPPPPPVLTQSECKIRTLWILFDSASRSLSWLSVCTTQAKGQWGTSSNIYSFHHSFISRFEMMKWN